MNKLKGLKPSLREKKRYIVFEIKSETEFSFEEVKKAIMNACFQYIGEFGVTKANPYIIKNQYKNNRGIMRVALSSLREIRAILPLIRHINKKKTMVHTIGVSGILKKARNKFLKKVI